jgi:lysophospholipase L1-like esterase
MMTKLFRLAFTALALSFSAFAPATAATNPPKVVFIGDWVTYLWTSGFAANANWINQGVLGIGGAGNSAGTLARFQSDVVSLHPAIVHIMLGSDDATETDDASFQLAVPEFLNNLDAMVKEAKAANIQVILGIEPAYFSLNPQVLESIDGVIANYGAANNIPVINYGDALCVCVGSVSGITLASQAYGSSFGYTIAGNGPLIVPSTYTGTEVGSWFVPGAAGYSLMTQLAETAISTLNLTLKAGWLQDVQQQNSNVLLSGSGKNVNTVYPGAVIQFTPVGLYSDGSQQPLLNSNFQGSSGTWTSSNPLVMNISQTGVAWALSPGTAIVQYVSPGGVKFAEWIMYVLPPLPG